VPNGHESSWDIKPWFELYQTGLYQIKNVLASILTRSINFMKDSVILFMLDEVNRVQRAN
jgi:hypothetical protein